MNLWHLLFGIVVVIVIVIVVIALVLVRTVKCHESVARCCSASSSSYTSSYSSGECPASAAPCVYAVRWLAKRKVNETIFEGQFLDTASSLKKSALLPSRPSLTQQSDISRTSHAPDPT